MRRLPVLLSLLLLSSCMSAPAPLAVTSSAFPEGGLIPEKYTCEGDHVIPPLSIGNIPKEAKTLSLLLIDPDAPRPGGFMHWAVWNVPAGETEWPEGAAPAGATEGNNDTGKPGYFGPCPPTGTHRYVFTVTAYGDAGPDLPQDASRAAIEAAFGRNAIARGTLTGTYVKVANRAQ